MSAETKMSEEFTEIDMEAIAHPFYNAHSERLQHHLLRYERRNVDRTRKRVGLRSSVRG